MPLSDTATARYARRNKAKRAAKLAEWLAKNKEHRARYCAARYLRRKEISRAYDAARYLRPENVEKRKALAGKRKAYMIEFHRNNLHIWRDADARRKAIKRGNDALDNAAIKAWTKRWRSRVRVTCYWCGKRHAPTDCHTDHVTPLAKGGAHAMSNLCISCADCNQRKHDKPLQRWNNELRQPALL